MEGPVYGTEPCHPPRVSAKGPDASGGRFDDPHVFGSNRSGPGLIGRHPSLTDLDQGDLKFGIDFRSVYAGVLQRWLDTPSKPILGEQFPLLQIIKSA